MAHELEGHRAAVLNGRTFEMVNFNEVQNNLLEEIQASIRASKQGKDLSKIERFDLYQDALERFNRHKTTLKGTEYENFTFEQIIETLWTTQN